jgi:molecular chaperone GrpE
MPDPPAPDAPPADDAGAPVGAPAPASAEPIEDWATRYRYLLADFENFRRRTERDREGLSRQVRGAMLRELLPIIEAFRAGREAVAKLPPESAIRHGLELLDREWATFLKHEGVEPVARLGAPFRPEEAEAVGEVAASDAAPEGTVAEIVQQGYRYFGGLLRPAKVVVARRPEEPGSAAAALPPSATSGSGSESAG